MATKTIFRLFTSALLALSFSAAHAGALAVSSPNSSPSSLTLTGAGVNQFVFSPTISATTTNYNLRAAAVAAGWDGVKVLNATVTVASGVVVGSTANNTYAFDTGSGFSAGSTLALINNGSIIGKGGAANGGNGGPALNASAVISITNNGTIGGGGGGGGNGAYTYGAYAGNTAYGAGGGGGGGQGYIAGSGGGTVGSTSGSAGINNNAAGGGSGSVSSAGGGGGGGVGYTIYHNDYYVAGGGGGAGGALGQVGGGGSSGDWRPGVPTRSTLTAAVNGGLAGAAVTGNSNITWMATGTRRGAIN